MAGTGGEGLGERYAGRIIGKHAMEKRALSGGESRIGRVLLRAAQALISAAAL